MKRWPILTVALEHEGDVVLARQRARRIAGLLEFDLQDQTRIATAVSEIARNAQGYAHGGRVEFVLEGTARRAESLSIRIVDRGPGLADPDAVLDGRFRSSTGLGVGISGSRRLMDGFELQSRSGEGVAVTMSKRLPAAAAFVPDQRIGELTRRLAADVSDDPMSELRLQNQELLRSLEALEVRRLEAVQLGEELERTNRGVVALYAELDEKAAELQRLNASLEQRVAAALEDRAQAEARLRQSQKMEAVGQLTGGIAHDFNNLLMVIGGSLELLRRRVPADPAITRLLDAAGQGVARGGSLNQQLLAFARKQDLREEVFCVNSHREAFSQLIERAVREDITLHHDFSENLWHCRTDPHQLETAVLNLAINARDAMPSGGALTIATSNAAVDEESAARWDAEPGDYVAVSVEDTGVGMTPEIVSRVFEPFFTTKEVGRGTGLGLSQVYGFAKQSGGFVSIRSEPGRGTRIAIHLRRSAPDGVPAATPPPPSTSVGRTASVLVVEDDAAVREMTTSLLRDLGYRVTEASTGSQALRRLEEQTFDLVFTDVVLPEQFSGVELADAVAKHWPATPVLLTSGYTAQRLKVDGTLRVLVKPYDRAQLAQAIDSALG